MLKASRTKVIPEADASRFAQLPLIVGEGANEFAAEVLSKRRPERWQRTPGGLVKR